MSWLGPSTSIFTVAFSVDRKDPKFLYRMNTTLTCPARGTGGEKKHRKMRRKRIKERECEKKRQMLHEKGDTDRSIKERGVGGRERKDQIQKWGHNMVMGARVTEIESGE